MHLHALYAAHHKEENLAMDPVGWLDRSLDVRDLELWSILLQGISYGRVEQIRVSYRALLQRFESLGLAPNGAGLYTWLAANDPTAAEVTKELRGWKHRLNVHGDIQQVLTVLRTQVCVPNRSIATWFASLEGDGFEERVMRFCSSFEVAPKARRSRGWGGTGASWFAPTPARGGTAKRLMMWLRWMLREDGVDLGLWRTLLPETSGITQADLLIPVDTHIFRFAREWKLVSHKNPTWASVKSITAALKAVDPLDPIRFDFAICHAGKLAARQKEL